MVGFVFDVFRGAVSGVGEVLSHCTANRCLSPLYPGGRAVLASLSAAAIPNEDRPSYFVLNLQKYRQFCIFFLFYLPGLRKTLFLALPANLLIECVSIMYYVCDLVDFQLHLRYKFFLLRKINHFNLIYICSKADLMCNLLYKLVGQTEE